MIERDFVKWKMYFEGARLKKKLHEIILINASKRKRLSRWFMLILNETFEFFVVQVFLPSNQWLRGKMKRNSIMITLNKQLFCCTCEEVKRIFALLRDATNLNQLLEMCISMLLTATSYILMQMVISCVWFSGIIMKIYSEAVYFLIGLRFGVRSTLPYLLIYTAFESRAHIAIWNKPTGNISITIYECLI